MSERYQIVSPSGSDETAKLPESQTLAGLLVKDHQLILPLLDLVEQAQCAIDDLVDVMGRATIEAVPQMSAEQLAGPKQQGKKSDRDVVYHGSQSGRVKLGERQLKVSKPRLRKKQRSARTNPAKSRSPPTRRCTTTPGWRTACSHILMRGVSTRNYAEVLPEMAETVRRLEESGLAGVHRGGRTTAPGAGGAGLLRDAAAGDLHRRPAIRPVPRDLCGRRR